MASLGAGFQERSGASVSGTVRDAEQSVEYLCSRFEELSRQLAREEQKHRDVDERCHRLREEVASRQSEVAELRKRKAEEQSSSESLLTSLRAAAFGAAEGAERQAARLREEQAACQGLEELCDELSKECKYEANACSSTLERLAAKEREIYHEKCENDQATRALRRLESDSTAGLEDARIAQQRLLLAKNEHESLQADLAATRSVVEQFWEDREALAVQAPLCRRQLGEHAARIEALQEASEALRQETASQELQRERLRQSEQSCFLRADVVKQETSVQRHELSTKNLELQAELQLVRSRTSECESLEQQKAALKTESFELLAKLRSVTSLRDDARSTVGKAQEESNLVTKRLEDLAAEERSYVAVASELRKARHTEDLAFEDVQSELQWAFRRREALADELAAHTQSRDALQLQLRIVTAEVREADARSSTLEADLARGSADLETHLAQQRRAHAELSEARAALRRLQRRESSLTQPRSQLFRSPAPSPATVQALASRGLAGTSGGLPQRHCQQLQQHQQQQQQQQRQQQEQQLLEPLQPPPAQSQQLPLPSPLPGSMLGSAQHFP